MTTPFPQWQWGSPHNPLLSVVERFAATRPGSWVSRKLAPLDRWLLERTDAKYTLLGPVGAPVILLTTVGRKSAQPRTQALLYVHDGDTLYVIGSNYGQAHHPSWTANLLAEPSATVTIAGEQIAVTATPIEGAAKGPIFQRFVEVWSPYAKYRDRTTRDLRIFALTRAIPDPTRPAPGCR
ncbi:nitroreductase family deazaflavin-dependent oxidoreductase [Nocardia gipuzkoensis]|uniref:nitroreductase family deazaflavin-dependent oxidoreductase n=1 Tax=Nocardia gipuzkoensis TaxID=2749991 RepID=UPI001E3B9A28|nr:nitroreductase family deazaflavin-dependent oxidoreductase [Nocardia gipuzkoensis]UGT69145.1 nitroreductase family deazaflavin-dependent oxidoreductase [Nocardia gipuzkoensis]